MTTSRVAIIPARGGSKRVLRKNVREFGGEPLIVHTLRAALNASSIDRLIVTSDCQEILEIAKDLGALPHYRPPELADEYSHASSATIEAATSFGLDSASLVCQLLPTSPLRCSDDVDRCFEFFEEDPASPVVCVSRQDPNFWWTMKMGSGGRLEPLWPAALTARSQDLEATYVLTGAISWSRLDELRQAKTFLTDNTRGWEIDRLRAIDIDDETDLLFAEAIWKALL